MYVHALGRFSLAFLQIIQTAADIGIKVHSVVSDIVMNHILYLNKRANTLHHTDVTHTRTQLINNKPKPLCCKMVAIRNKNCSRLIIVHSHI